MIMYPNQMYNQYPNQNGYTMNQNPYRQMFDMQNSQPVQSLIRVTGIEGAKAYQMNPNSTSALFDNNEDLMYIKSTDGAGFPTIRIFKFEEVTEFSKNNESTINLDNYITKDELFEILKDYKKGGFGNGKQSIQEQSTSK